MRYLSRSLLLAWLFTAAAAADETGLVVRDAWIREAPPGASVLAGYLQLENRGPEALVVDTMSSRDFGRIELHRTLVEEGVARMLPVGHLEIAAGESVILEPGGMHLMLFNPGRPLQVGDGVDFSIQLANGVSHAFQATVRRGAADKAHQHHDHQHHQH
jgi:copper(I)-binding protein